MTLRPGSPPSRFVIFTTSTADAACNLENSRMPIFSPAPAFLLPGLSYMKELPPERADRHRERTGGAVC
jgi:hypothetical protein